MKPFFYLCLLLPFSHYNAADARVKAGTVTGGSAQAGSATGGSVTGGSATGGSATGGSVTGGSATGGSATGGSVTGGNATAGAARAGSTNANAGHSQPGTATPGTVGAGTATAHVNGREIRVSAASSVSVNVNDSAAEISVGGRSLSMTKTKLLHEGRPLAEFPAAAKKIEIHLDDTDMLTVKSDGKEAARVKMPER